MEQSVTGRMVELVIQNSPNRYVNVSFSPGETITSIEQPARHFYVLNKGSAKLIHEEPSAKSVILDIYHPGDFFGEIEMIGLSPNERTIVAMTQCDLCKIERTQFLYLYETCPEFSLHILRVHCERLLRTGDSQIHAECMVLRKKVFRIIQDHLNNHSNYFLYTKAVLAEMAGVSIRSLNRVLSELEAEKLIVVSNGTIRLDV